MSSENRLPPIPYKTKVLRANGHFTEPWVKFFRELFFRLGGNSEVPTGGADVVTNTNNINDLLLRVEALEQEPVA